MLRQFIFSIEFASQEQRQSVLLYKFKALHFIEHCYIITYARLVCSHIVYCPFKVCELAQLGSTLCITLAHIIGYLLDEFLKNFKLTVILEAFCKALRKFI